MNNLISVKPKIKIKGFSSGNLKILSNTKENDLIKHRINRLKNTSFYSDLSDAYKIIINRIISSYDNSLSGNELKHVPSSPVISVDSVAAGDAFTAGLAVAISEGLTLIEAAELGSAAGALATTRRGAQIAMPFRAEVDSLMNKTTKS